ncbi:tRNA lysidine(34) synthetase TilS [Fibrobacter sp.]|uniref:tRNA lysidine(34) synthetase TilS n=1 Tax=Fibrobacter sp. TaxID=35828 RepID=UPI00386D6627
MITDELASIKKRILDYGFKRLLLAVSGGLDSICLAHYFIVNREALGIEWLGIAHVHHGLREGTADRDAAFVEDFARKYNVPFFLKKLDGESLKNAEGSLEENARDARYKALAEVFNETGDPPHTGTMRTKQQVAKCCPPVLRGDDNKGIIVTAHHAGDQAETMYMRLRRGTTLAGLRGIQNVRDNIYRPFLSVTRADLLAYAREHNLTWCEDESNTDVKFTRNKVRHEYLPHLEETNPGTTMQLCKVARLADKAYAKVMDKCNELFNPIVSLEKEMPELVGHDKSLDPAPSNLYETRLFRVLVELSSMGITQLRQQIAKFRISTPRCSAQDDTSLTTRPSSLISLNKKALRKILLAHADADLSEMFRLWLSELGFRFPIGFFYSQTEPAHVKIPVRAAYRKRSIVKKGSTVLICEFEDVQTASKFVSCGMKE